MEVETFSCVESRRDEKAHPARGMFQSILKVVKIVIPGGSGQVGTILRRGLRAAGHEVTVLSRSPHADEVVWDGETLGPWAEMIDGADAVVDLAGRSVNCRYTPAHRREILESRVRSVRVVGKAIARAKRPPSVWLQASTATIYSHRLDAPNDEATGLVEPRGPETWRFSHEVALAWEAALTESVTPATRKVALRSAMTMSPDRDGVFDVFSRLVRRGLGGAQGDGRQFVSWIHEADFLGAVQFLLRSTVVGPVNIAAPTPLPNRDFMRTLREAWGVPLGLPAPAPLLEIGAWAMRTETELILKSRRVVPTWLLEAAFEFRFPEWAGAARDLVARSRAGASG